jgi:hypothetical protein
LRKVAELVIFGLAIGPPSNNVHKSLDEPGQARSDFGAGLCFAAVLTAAPTRLLGLLGIMPERVRYSIPYCKVCMKICNTVILHSCGAADIKTRFMTAYDLLPTLATAHVQNSLKTVIHGPGRRTDCSSATKSVTPRQVGFRAYFGLYNTKQ